MITNNDSVEVFLDIYDTAISLGNEHEDAVEIALEAVQQEKEEEDGTS
jgi:hypothetical protein